MGLPEIRLAIQTALDGMTPTWSPSKTYRKYSGTNSESFEDSASTTPCRMYQVIMKDSPIDSKWSTGGVLDYAEVELVLRVSYPVNDFNSLEDLQDTLESDSLDVISTIRPVGVWNEVARDLQIGVPGQEVVEVSGTDGAETVVYINEFNIGVEYATGRT